MSALVEQSNQWSIAWMALVLAVLWQSTLLAAVIALVTWTQRRASPACRYWLWQIVAIKVLVMPLWTMTFAAPWPAEQIVRTMDVVTPAVQATETTTPMPNVQTTTATTAPIHAGQSQPASEPPARLTWQSWLMLGWLAIVLLQLAMLEIQRRRLSRLLRACQRAPDDLTAVVARVAGRLGLPARPAVLLTSAEGSPFVCGMFRSTLVVPRSLLARLSAVEVEQMVAHELAHVKRRDLIWAWTAQAARTLYFFHPVVHLVARRIRLERELACDQLAMYTTGHSPGEYARTLVRVMSHISEPMVSQAAVAMTGGETFSPQRHSGKPAARDSRQWRETP